MLEIGLTGGIGSGKSTAASIFVKSGALLIDADEIVRYLQQPGEAVFEAMLDRWGSEILETEGNLNRQAVADLVFSDQSELSALNEIVHPAVRSEMTKRREKYLGTDQTVILDIPLLAESGYRNFDGIVVIDIDPDLAVDRLMKYRSFSELDAKNRIQSQTNSETRLQIADMVISNNSSLEKFEQAVLECWKWITSLERPDLNRPLLALKD